MYSNQEICIIAYKVIIKCVALLYSKILLFSMAISEYIGLIFGPTYLFNSSILIQISI